MRTKHTLGGQPGVLAAHLSSILEGLSHLVKIIYVYTVRLQLRSSYSLNKKKGLVICSAWLVEIQTGRYCCDRQGETYPSLWKTILDTTCLQINHM